MRAAGAALVVVLAAHAGCTETTWTALPYPIPLTLSGPSGGLMAQARFAGSQNPTVPVVVDTGTVLTAYQNAAMSVSAQMGDLRLFGVDASGAAIPRVDFHHIQLFTTPLGPLGVDGTTAAVQGVIGGDNLSRFAMELDYRAAAPTMTVVENVQPCSCELEPRLDQPDACDAVLSFSLAGGNDSALQSQTRIIIGNDQYTYPPTRVLLDACLEPYPDPLTTIVPGLPSYGVCATNDGRICPSKQYMPAGVDVRMIVATGFPGLALSASAYDRLRGAGAADQLLAGPTVTLHLPDTADKAGIPAAQTTIGRAVATGDPGADALALVSREHYYGPCALLSRSRRQRRRVQHPEESACTLSAGDQLRKCPDASDSFVDECAAAGNEARFCNDFEGDSPSPAVIEMTTPLPVFVLPDLAPLLVGINSDVRPSDSTVEGVIGTEVLRRMVLTVDYPGSRVIARCASNADCKAYSRLSVGTSDCGFCAGSAQDVERPATALEPCPVAP